MFTITKEIVKITGTTTMSCFKNCSKTTWLYIFFIILHSKKNIWHLQKIVIYLWFTMTTMINHYNKQFFILCLIFQRKIDIWCINTHIYKIFYQHLLYSYHIIYYILYLQKELWHQLKLFILNPSSTFFISLYFSLSITS